MEDLKYPTGRFVQKEFSEEQKDEWIAELKFLPNVLESLVQDLDEAQLQKPYRPGGWTVHQLVHHVADSHMNAYIRFKLGYTEPEPVIKPYVQDRWVETADVAALPVNVSLTLLFALHQKLVVLLESFDVSDWEKNIYHPEENKTISLWQLLGMYAWHGRHHAAHIRNLRERESF